jgi:hypothetical protein
VELSAFQRFVAFAVVVMVLAGLGVYLFLPQSRAAGTSPSPGPRSSSRSPSRGPHSSAPTARAMPDIYQWLPFTRADLASAAATTTAFATRYGTYSYTESAQAYLATMRPLITSQLATALGRAFATPGVAGPRASTKQVATAAAAILALRAFGPSSLTFVVAITQRIASTKGASRHTADYAVTLIGTGSAWQIYDIEAASAGNQ